MQPTTRPRRFRMQNREATGDNAWNILRLLQWTTSYFTSRSIENPRAAAEILGADVLQVERIDLYVRHDLPLSAGELGRFRELIRRRVTGEPVAYITGRREFWSMDFAVTPAVLIPRPETEILVEQGLEKGFPYQQPEASPFRENIPARLAR